MLKNSKGFTLVELMITVGILGALASVASTNYALFVEKAKYGRARAEMGSFVKMIIALRESEDRVFGQMASYCTVCFGRTFLGGWAQLGYQEVPRDPWGEPYSLDENENEFSTTDCRHDTIISTGPDRVYGTGIDGVVPNSDDLLSAVPFHTSTHPCPVRPIVAGGH